jgi:hypothetical protein
MSELTLCNYCQLRYLKRHIRPGTRLVLTPDADGGTRCYIVPIGEEPNESHFVAWYMELTAECCC